MSPSAGEIHKLQTLVHTAAASSAYNSADGTCRTSNSICCFLPNSVTEHDWPFPTNQTEPPRLLRQPPILNHPAGRLAPLQNLRDPIIFVR